jgi:hypothetical protein
VLVGDNSALRELAICRQEKKTFGKPAYDCGFTVCQYEVGQKPASGRSKREQNSAAAHFLEQDLWLVPLS